MIEHLGYRMTRDPTMHRRAMAFLAVAFGHMGQDDKARKCAAWFIEGMQQVWRGDSGAGPREYADWLVDVTYLKRTEDEALLREGLRLVGLPTRD